MVIPNDGESFTSGDLHLIAAAHDPKIDTNEPSYGLGGNASQVIFYADNDSTPILTVNGGQAEYWMFKGFAWGLGVGTA